MRSVVAAGCGLLLLIWLAPEAAALRYKPQPDESLGHIARIHYGTAKKRIYLMAANRITDPAQVAKRRSLWIPTVWKYRLRRGDDLARLARKYLKAPKRADFLMWLNQIENPRDLDVGSVITIPFLLRHRVQEGQTMVDVARRYYFKAKLAGLLRKFNDKRTNALEPGEIILVPIYDPEITTAKVKERIGRYRQQVAKAAREARERAKRRAAARAQERAAEDDEPAADDEPGAAAESDEAERVAAAADGEGDGGAAEPDAAAEQPAASPAAQTALIEQAYGLYRDGEYELARANLMRALESDKLARDDEAEAREVLAHCLVALGEIKQAEHEFVRLLMIAPDRTLDPVTTSPKVLEVFRRARGSR
jgi:TolA-binding protein